MQFPQDLKYTKDHEWAKIEGDTVTVGITDHAQSSLGDIVYVDLPAVGRELKGHETFGVVESIKAVSDLYCPVAGKVLDANNGLKDDPGQINRKPYDCWLIKLSLTDKAGLGEMMDAAAYAKYVATQG